MENKTDKIIDKIIQELINNPDRDCNCPDEVYFGEWYSYRNQSAFPFLNILLPDENEPRFIIGEPGTPHRDINNKIIEECRAEANDDFHTLNKKFGGYILKTYTENVKRGRDKSEAFEKAKYWGVRDWIEDNEQAGRYFLIELYDKKICIFTFWNVWEQEDSPGERPDSIQNTELIKMVMERDSRVRDCDYILIANNDKPFYVYKEDLPDDYFKIGDNSAQRAIHLANGQEKREFFKDFRNNREKQLGDLLAYHDKEGNKTGREMPLAQWNAMRRVEESKESKRIFLSEEQIKFINEWGDKKPVHYSMDDKLELVNDPNVVDGGNFAIKRNGKEYWVSRSMIISLYVFGYDKNGILHVLASQRGPGSKAYKGLWNVITGYLDYGYSLEDTCVKECWEETGVKIDKNNLIQFSIDSSRLHGDVSARYYTLLPDLIENHVTSINNCEPGEVSIAKWVPIDELSKYKFMGHQAQCAYSLGKRIESKNSNNSLIQNNNYKLFMDSLNGLVKDGIVDKNDFDTIVNIIKR